MVPLTRSSIDVVGDRDHTADGALVGVEDVDQDPLPTEQPGQGHHERGDPESGDDGALKRSDEGARQPCPTMSAAHQTQFCGAPIRAMAMDAPTAPTNPTERSISLRMRA